MHWINQITVWKHASRSMHCMPLFSKIKKDIPSLELLTSYALNHGLFKLFEQNSSPNHSFGKFSWATCNFLGEHFSRKNFLCFVHCPWLDLAMIRSAEHVRISKTIHWTPLYTMSYTKSTHQLKTHRPLQKTIMNNVPCSCSPSLFPSSLHCCDSILVSSNSPSI